MIDEGCTLYHTRNIFQTYKIAHNTHIYTNLQANNKMTSDNFVCQFAIDPPFDLRI